MDIVRRGSKASSDGPTGTSNGSYFHSMMEEMATSRFDTIRFPAYRAACRLRFIQKKTNMHLVDLNNVIEAIRGSGLDAYTDKVNTEMSLPRLETLIKSMYYQLSERLPPSQGINIEQAAILLFTFLTALLDPNGRGTVKVFSVKVCLVNLSSGKIEDKLICMFSIMSNPKNSALMPDRFKLFIRDLLSLGGLFDSDPYFAYDDSIPFRIISFDHSVKLNEFIETVFNPQSPPLVFSFFMAFSRMPFVETVIHPVTCESCRRREFSGFRYKCQECSNFHLCQECFWRGRTSGSHDPDIHPCREFSFWESQVPSTPRRSFRLLPSQKPKTKKKEDANVTLHNNKNDVKHSLPNSPVPSHNQMHFNHGNKVSPSTPFARDSVAYKSMPNMRSPTTPKTGIRNMQSHVNQVMLNNNPLIHPPGGPFPVEDEHQLVAEYTRKLSFNSIASPMTSRRGPHDNNVLEVVDPELMEKQRLVTQLELRNREIMREIERLKRGEVTPDDFTQEVTSSTPLEPMYASELTILRKKKEELEKHLTALHYSRKDLLNQLEGLMKLLKNSQTGLLTSAPSSTTSSLSRSHSQRQTRQAGTGDFRATQSFRSKEPTPDSVKKAVRSLARELHSEDEAVMDEMGLALTKKLAANRPTSKPPPVPKHQSQQVPAQVQVHRSSSIRANMNGNRKEHEDFDEDELDLQMLHHHMVTMRSSSQDVNGMSVHVRRTSLRSNDDYDMDDTDIYPETDDEFYSTNWASKRQPVMNGHY